MAITKDLQAIRKELTRLVKQTEKLAEVLGKTEKKNSLKTKTKEKDITQKAPAKAARKTYTDKVLAIIKKSKKGVNTDTLMEKTGLDRDQVHQIIFKAHKQGKITRIEKGIYVGAK
jgi:predicted Rossmann fold nucleotide-binding protein DprA/Smf involved in DNA uptake